MVKEIGEYDPETGEIHEADAGGGEGDDPEVEALQRQLAAIREKKAAARRAAEAGAAEADKADAGEPETAAEAPAEVVAEAPAENAGYVTGVDRDAERGEGDDDGGRFDQGDPGPQPEEASRAPAPTQTRTAAARPPAQRTTATRQAAASAEPAKPLSEQASARGTRGRAVATQTRSTALATDADLVGLFEEDAGRGVDFQRRDIVIPRSILLQDNSPQVKEGTQGYVQGAKAGMILNSVTGYLTAEFAFIPVSYARRFVGWRPRDAKGAGGGLFRPDVPEEEYQMMEEVKIGKRIYEDERGGQPDRNGNPTPGVIEVVDTPEWIGLASYDGGSTWEPLVMDMAGTKAKTAAKINTIIVMQVGKRADGSEYTLPVFANVFNLKTAREGEGSQSYFTYATELLGRVPDKETYMRARELRKQVAGGEVEVASMSQDAAA